MGNADTIRVQWAQGMGGALPCTSSASCHFHPRMLVRPGTRWGKNGEGSAGKFGIHYRKLQGGGDDGGKVSGEGKGWQSAATHRYLDQSEQVYIAFERLVEVISVRSEGAVGTCDHPGKLSVHRDVRMLQVMGRGSARG
jgi:hypothetical protein